MQGRIERQSEQNWLIAALDEYHREAFLAACKMVDLPQEHSLYCSGEQIQYGYFLVSGMSSELVHLRDGQAIDTGPIGREGFVGLQLLLGDDVAKRDCMMQIPGRGWRVQGDVVRELFLRAHGLGPLLHRYIGARLLQATQAAVCNLLHTVEERLARWLLTAHDHSASDILPLTHEFLSEMLGANRSTVTITAGKFDKADLIDYRRGRVRIVNREGLLETTCECYQMINEIFRHVTRPEST
jgi:CRP-like cAMP-binding protein